MLTTLLPSSWKSANSQRWGWKDKEETIEGLRDKWCLRELDILFLAAPFFLMLSSVSSVTQSCPNFCDLMDYSTPDFCVCHQIPGAYTNSCTLSRWCHPIISSSVVPFCSCLQSFPASGSFQMSQLFTRWPKYWSFSISPSNEYSVLISFKVGRLYILAVQGTLKSLLQHQNSKASICRCSVQLFIVQLSHPYIITRKTIALARQTFVGKAMSCFLICCLCWS